MQSDHLDLIGWRTKLVNLAPQPAPPPAIPLEAPATDTDDLVSPYHSWLMAAAAIVVRSRRSTRRMGLGVQCEHIVMHTML